MLWNRVITGLSALILAGCQSMPTVLPKSLPPVDLMQDCLDLCPPLETNGDLARCIRELRMSLQTCNIDKKALREWAEQQ